MEEITLICKVLKHCGEEGYEQYSSSATFSFEELQSKIKEKYSEFIFTEERKIEVLEYTSSGRVKTVKIGNINISGVELRSILGLKSTNFEIVVGDNIEFKVIGYGHGVRNEPNWR